MPLNNQHTTLTMSIFLKFSKYFSSFPILKLISLQKIIFSYAFMKCFLAICVMASLSLISFSAFYNHSKWSLASTSGCGRTVTTRVITSRHYDTLKEPTNITHVLFGIAGSAHTWKGRHHYSELWWNPNMTRGFVWLDKDPKDWPENSPPFKLSQDTSQFKHGFRSAIRIARIVKESFQLGLPDIRWFVFGDDDTVFFTDNLITVLGKYDHNQMYYVGGNSESVEQDLMHTYEMAFGGGGFAISFPLAAGLARILDGCIDRYSHFYGGDQKIQACISEIGVPFTKELGFHQMDIRRDPYGILAAHPLAPLVSLHHLDYVDPIIPGLSQPESLEILVQAYGADPGRTLQHSFCYDMKRNWTISVSWGYTVQIYPSLVTAKVLETPVHTFVTWRSLSQKAFTFDTRVIGSDPCDQPFIYFLNQTEVLPKIGRTLTKYKRSMIESDKRCDQEDYVKASIIDSIDVSAEKLKTSVWKKAPRRQCCDIANGGKEDHNVQVKIRNCRVLESVTVTAIK